MQRDSWDSEDEEADKNSENTRVNPDQLVLTGHTVTVRTNMVLILLFTLCHSRSGTQLADLLTLISIHCLHLHPRIKSVYKFKHFFAMFVDVKSPVCKHFYCTSCLSPVTERDGVCPKRNCNQPLSNSRAKGYFLEIPLKNQLRNILQKVRFSRKKKMVLKIYTMDQFRSHCPDQVVLCPKIVLGMYHLLGIQMVYLYSKALNFPFGHFILL